MNGSADLMMILFIIYVALNAVAKPMYLTHLHEQKEDGTGEQTMIEVKAKFYSVQEKLPEKSGYYLCMTSAGHLIKLQYSEKYHLFNATDAADVDDAYTWSIDCDYWANLEDFAELRQVKENYE